MQYKYTIKELKSKINKFVDQIIWNDLVSTYFEMKSENPCNYSLYGNIYIWTGNDNPDLTGLSSWACGWHNSVSVLSYVIFSIKHQPPLDHNYIRKDDVCHISMLNMIPIIFMNLNVGNNQPESHTKGKSWQMNKSVRLIFRSYYWLGYQPFNIVRASTCMLYM